MAMNKLRRVMKFGENPALAKTIPNGAIRFSYIDRSLPSILSALHNLIFLQKNAINNFHQ
jgi:hypothetical protein